MVMRRSRQEAKLKSRAALIAAGMELIGRGGLEGPSLDAICERAGYTRGAFYVHFADRDELVAAVMERVGAEFLSALFATTGGSTGLAETVRRFVAAVASGAYPLTGKGGVRPHQLLQACARSPHIRRRYVELISRSIALLTQVLRSGQRARTVRRDVDGTQAATLLLATVIGAQTMLELDFPFDPLKTAATVLRLLDSPRPPRTRTRHDA
jgi:AcrR family transcriptional regulator